MRQTVLRSISHLSKHINTTVPRLNPCRTFTSTTIKMVAQNELALAQRMKDGGTDKLDVWSIFT
jgi:hypothetical protein